MVFVDCVICHQEMSTVDCGPDGTEASCLKCRARFDRREAEIRALVAKAHEEGRMPPELRAASRAAIDAALARYGR